MVRMLFKKVYVLGEQYLLEQHLIRTRDGEDAVPKSIFCRPETGHQMLISGGNEQ
jgi:hypothetical protein